MPAMRISASVLINYGTTFVDVNLPGFENGIVMQARSAIRISWGADDTAYFTYDIMTEPVIVPPGCRIRAETGTADVIRMGVAY